MCKYEYIYVSFKAYAHISQERHCFFVVVAFCFCLKKKKDFWKDTQTSVTEGYLMESSQPLSEPLSYPLEREP